MSGDWKAPLVTLKARDDLLELAEHYETVAALEVSADAAGRAVPGPRVPPGMQEILEDDEVTRALVAVDADALSWAHMVLDARTGVGEPSGAISDLTPNRLRFVAERVASIVDGDDEWFVRAFLDDLDDRLRTMQRLARRGVKLVRTGRPCQDPTCQGHYVSPLGKPGVDRHDDSLHCDRCAHVVPHAVWSSWPMARVQWITVEHAARMAGTTVDAIKKRASREKWRRIGTGRDVRYAVADVMGERVGA